MTSKLMKQLSKGNAFAAVASTASVLSVGATAATVLSTVSADTVSAGSFDLTKQAGETTFPVTFDRPSGVNAAALAATVRNLGTDSQLYKSAVAAVPELADGTKMGSLLNDALSTDSAKQTEARTTIVKLINWYNSLGGKKITTQSGEAYTVANLDQPINTIAVAFSNNKSINDAVTKAIDTFGNVKSVQDVMTILDTFGQGTSSAYTKAFNDYKAKYDAATDKSTVTSYDALKPVLEAYENMYATGAANIRKQLLANQSSSTEAGVAFFESAVISGGDNTSDNGTTDNNKVEQKDVRTRWVDESGKELSPDEVGKNFKDQKNFPGYTFKEVTTKDGTRTYVYTKTPTPEKKVTEDTVWVDESGKELKAKENGTKPDNDGKSDIPGYELVSTKTNTDKDGNKHTVNTYKKVAEPTPEVKPDTYWFDTEGNTLKPKAVGQSLPDNDGVSDIPGYIVKRVYTVTEKDLTGDTFKGSGFKVGDVINIYEKAPEQKEPNTKWVDENGKELKPSEKGSHPDNDGTSDIPGYELVTVKTDKDGNVTNVYRKVATPEKKVTEDTVWVDESGKELKPKEDGTKSDNDGKSDIPGYRLIDTKTSTDKDGNKHTVNRYQKVGADTVWVDESGKELKPKEEGTKPDNDGKSDIDGYVLIDTKTSTDDKGDTHTVNRYRKPTTEWVDENGKELKPKEEGQFPDNDGKSDIPGYELVAVKKDDQGNIRNIYRKVEAPKETPKETPKTPEKQTEKPKAPELPKTGDAGSLVGLVGALGATGGVAGLSNTLRRRKRNRK